MGSSGSVLNKTDLELFAEIFSGGIGVREFATHLRANKRTRNAFIEFVKDGTWQDALLCFERPNYSSLKIKGATIFAQYGYKSSMCDGRKETSSYHRTTFAKPVRRVSSDSSLGSSKNTAVSLTDNFHDYSSGISRSFSSRRQTGEHWQLVSCYLYFTTSSNVLAVYKIWKLHLMLQFV